MRRRRSRRARGAHGLLLVVTVALAVPGTASGHAAFSDAVPEPGSRLEASPSRVVLAFTEALNRRLTRATLIDARSGEAVAASARFEGGDRLVLRPRGALPSAPYRVVWHTVSRLDGHALEGSFGFGVRTAAPGGEAQLEQSPLARDGWLRVALRGLLYVLTIFFGGGLLVGALLSPATPAGWLRGGAVGQGRDAARRAWRRTCLAGWIAAAAAVAVALVETSDAAGSIGPGAIDAYVLSTASGLARLATVACLAAAALVAARWRRVAAALLVGALLSIAIGGHANSASPRGLAVTSDWLHLVAATVWIGGIAQIVLAWLPRIRSLDSADRHSVMRNVLAPFGRIALPAFAVVVAAGVVNAVIELGRLRELWSSGYGLALATKVALVGVVALASYVHALRLRPRLVSARSDGHPTAERRHWRLLGLEPGLGVGVVGVAALLAVFPVPPRQLFERAEAGDESPTGPASLRAPRRGELAVAWHAGPWIAAAWMSRAADGLAGTVRLFSPNLVAPHAAIGVRGAVTTVCGKGCARFRRVQGAELRLAVATRHRRYDAVLPARWDHGGEREASRLAKAATRVMRRLRTVRVAEHLSGGVGLAVTSRYRLQAPDRYASVVRSVQVNRDVVIGARSWFKSGDGQWRYETLGDRFDARSFFPWVGHLRGARLLGRFRRRVDVALADPGGADASRPPFWFVLTIDRATMRVVRMRMTAPGHFMTQRYFAFDAPGTIRPPR